MSNKVAEEIEIILCYHNFPPFVQRTRLLRTLSKTPRQVGGLYGHLSVLGSG